jgi:Clp amino terminal domain, pathogenicity island component
MRDRLARLLRAAAGDDGTGAVWERLTPGGREVLRLAFAEARELGHPCIADEHILLGLLRHGSSPAAALLRAQGLEVAAARADLLRIGPALPRRADPVRHRLEAAFGTDALHAAERRVRRRPRWRGGHPRPRPLCVYLLARRSLILAVRFADQRGDAAIGPVHLLYGVVRDAGDPLGAQLSGRSRRQLAGLGWRAGRPNPLRLLLEARGIDLARLTTQLGRTA